MGSCWSICLAVMVTVGVQSTLRESASAAGPRSALVGGRPVGVVKCGLDGGPMGVLACGECLADPGLAVAEADVLLPAARVGELDEAAVLFGDEELGRLASGGVGVGHGLQWVGHRHSSS